MLGFFYYNGRAFLVTLHYLLVIVVILEENDIIWYFVSRANGDGSTDQRRGDLVADC